MTSGAVLFVVFIPAVVTARRTRDSRAGVGRTASYGSMSRAAITPSLPAPLAATTPQRTSFSVVHEITPVPSSGQVVQMSQRRPTRSIVALLVTLAALSILVSTATATDVPYQCFAMTTTKGLNSRAILTGLPLTRDQKRELESRLASYRSVRGFEGLDGVGLTAGDRQIIQQRIQAQVDAMNSKTLGAPCQAFRNPDRSVLYIRSQLLYNGFRPSTKVYLASPRQIQIQGIQDGVVYFGAAVRVGGRRIAVQLHAASPNPGTAATFTADFDP